jgi:hypothetical protein
MFTGYKKNQGCQEYPQSAAHNKQSHTGSIQNGQVSIKRRLDKGTHQHGQTVATGTVLRNLGSNIDKAQKRAMQAQNRHISH